MKSVLVLGNTGLVCGLLVLITHRIYHRIVRFPVVFLFDSRARILAQVSGLQFKRSWFHDVYGLATQPRLPSGLTPRVRQSAVASYLANSAICLMRT